MIWRKKPLPSVPDGQRIYAVGDIHGRIDLMEQMIGMIVADDRERPKAERRTLIFLGDYIDRGPDSRAVIQRLLDGMPEGIDCIPLKGNHEAMLLGSLGGLNGMLPFWLANGGRATLTSYGVPDSHSQDAFSDGRLVAAMNEALPPRHREFLDRLQISVAFGDYFFVHAGVRPGTALDAQEEDDCIYIREPFLSHGGSFGKIVVHGHTPVAEPEIRANRIGIDTGAVFTGRLTALRLEDTSQTFLAT